MLVRPVFQTNDQIIDLNFKKKNEKNYGKDESYSSISYPPKITLCNVPKEDVFH